MRALKRAATPRLHGVAEAELARAPAAPELADESRFALVVVRALGAGVLELRRVCGFDGQVVVFQRRLEVRREHTLYGADVLGFGCDLIDISEGGCLEDAAGEQRFLEAARTAAGALDDLNVGSRHSGEFVNSILQLCNGLLRFARVDPRQAEAARDGRRLKDARPVIYGGFLVVISGCRKGAAFDLEDAREVGDRTSAWTRGTEDDWDSVSGCSLRTA
jgi:hypothetical protein